MATIRIQIPTRPELPALSHLICTKCKSNTHLHMLPLAPPLELVVLLLRKGKIHSCSLRHYQDQEVRMETKPLSISNSRDMSNLDQQMPMDTRTNRWRSNSSRGKVHHRDSRP